MPQVSNRQRAAQTLHASRHKEFGDSTDWLTRVGKRVVVMGECWVVDGRRDHYPDGSIGGVPELLHRAVYAETHPDEDISDMHVHHECLCPGCINPAHLTALTPSDHMALHQRLRRVA